MCAYYCERVPQDVVDGTWHEALSEPWSATGLAAVATGMLLAGTSLLRQWRAASKRRKELTDRG